MTGLEPTADRAPLAGMRAFLLAAGRGVRFRPVSAAIPKPLFPFLNVPLAVAHLERLRRDGVAEAALNLHHLGHQIEQHLVDRAAELPELRFFFEPEILGTAGGLRNASEFLSAGDFLVVNSDAAIEPDFGALVRLHRASARRATLLVVENSEPDRYTPLQSEGDRVTGFGGGPRRGALDRAAGGAGGTGGGRPPLLYTGVCVLSPSLLAGIPPGETSLVAHVWEPLLERGEEIGFVLHEGPFADLGRPRDFLRASLEALARGGPFPRGAGAFDERSRVLSRVPLPGVEASRSVVGDSAVAAGARLAKTVVWSGAEVGRGARLERCLLARGVVPADADLKDAILWGAAGETVAAFPLDEPAHGFHPASPRR